jgi:hypothetical protein
MLQYGLVHWSAFFVAALLLNLAPGPDLAFISFSISEKLTCGFTGLKQVDFIALPRPFQ